MLNEGEAAFYTGTIIIITAPWQYTISAHQLYSTQHHQINTTAAQSSFFNFLHDVPSGMGFKNIQDHILIMV